MVDIIQEAIKIAEQRHGEYYDDKLRGYQAIIEELGEYSQASIDGESKERCKSELIDTIVALIRYIDKYYK